MIASVCLLLWSALMVVSVLSVAVSEFTAFRTRRDKASELCEEIAFAIGLTFLLVGSFIFLMTILLK